MAAVIQRRTARLALLALAAVAASGCTTFSDDDAVARVGDDELTSDALTALLDGVGSPLDPTGQTPAVVDGVAQGDAARSAVSRWIQSRIVGASAIGERYTADPAELGVTCLDVAVAQDQADAEAIKARLDAGETWDEVVGPLETSIGYESQQECTPLGVYEAQLGPEVAARLGALKPGGAPEVVDAGQAGFAVVRIQSLDDLDTGTLLAAVQGLEPDAVQALIDSVAATDVYVDPRVGRFDLDSVSVVPVS